MQLSGELGLPTRLSAVAYPRPGLVIYEGLELFDPETGKLLVRIPTLHASRSASGLALVARECQIESGGTQRLWHELERLLLKRKSTPDEVGIRLALGELTIRRTDGRSKFVDLTGDIRSLEAGRQAAISFRLAGAESESAATLKFFRNQNSEPAMTGFELESPFPIPCSLLPPVNPLSQWLGTESRFRGYAWARHSPQGGEGRLIQAEFSKVDLQRLIGRPFGQTIRGTGTVLLAEAELSAGRLRQASGVVRAGPGFIGRPLLASSLEHLHLTSERPFGADPELLFDELAFEFHLDPSGVELWGACRHGPPGAILVDRADILAGEPEQRIQPLTSLVRALAPPTAPFVPANLEAEWLLRILPLPAAETMHAATRREPTGGKRFTRTDPRTDRRAPR